MYAWRQLVRRSLRERNGDRSGLRAARTAMYAARRREALRLRLEELERRHGAAALGAYRRELLRQSREGMREERRVERAQDRAEVLRLMMTEADEPALEPATIEPSPRRSGGSRPPTP